MPQLPRRSPRAPRRRTVRTLAVALAVVGLLPAAGSASTATPTTPAGPATATGPAAPPSPAQAADDFYVPPDPLPAGAPGDVIRSRPSAAGPPATRAMAEAWQVMYLSTDALGAPTAVTGTVLVPTGADPATMPVVGLGPGTQGPAFSCAPSRMVASGAFYEQPAVNDMLARGYAVAVADYPGYHPTPDTSYMTGRAMGPALLDAVRAAQRLPEAALSPDAPVVVRGYSQGGSAAMWAGQLQPDYAPELDLVGVAAGGVPADLIQVGLPLEGGEGFGFFLYAILGLDNAYPELALDSYLNDAGRAEVARMESEVCTLELIRDYPGQSIQDYVTTSPLLEPEWLARLGENKLGATPIEVPVFQYHEVEDGLVAFDQADTLHQEYCALGVPLTWETYDTGGTTGIIRHINLVYHGNADVNAFIEDRIAGVPPTSNC